MRAGVTAGTGLGGAALKGRPAWLLENTEADPLISATSNSTDLVLTSGGGLGFTDALDGRLTCSPGTAAFGGGDDGTVFGNGCHWLHAPSGGRVGSGPAFAPGGGFAGSGILITWSGTLISPFLRGAANGTSGPTNEYFGSGVPSGRNKLSSSPLKSSSLMLSLELCSPAELASA